MTEVGPRVAHLQLDKPAIHDIMTQPSTLQATGQQQRQQDNNSDNKTTRGNKFLL
jgi:hypothetical protein